MFQLFWSHIPVLKRQETGIGTFFYSNKIHIFEFAGMGAWTYVLEHASQDIPQGRTWFLLQFKQPKSPNEDTFNFIATQNNSIGKRRDISDLHRKTKFFRNGE